MAKFDKDYFEGKGSHYIHGYTWEQEQGKSRIMAMKVVGTLNPTSVLELGCACGFQLRVFEESGIKAHGCDISEVADKDNMKICDIKEGLPYKDNEFDIIFTDSTLEHIETEFIPKIMKEVYRVARRGFYLKVPIGLTTENEPWGDKTHVTYLSPSYWISKAFDAGWLIDLRRSEHRSKAPFQDLEAVFFKRLPE